jgi:hypothetical protein
MHAEVVEEHDNLQSKFFDALLQDDVKQVTKFFSNSSISPWKYVETGGYTGNILKILLLF